MDLNAYQSFAAKQRNDGEPLVKPKFHYADTETSPRRKSRTHYYESRGNKPYVCDKVLDATNPFVSL